MSFKHRLFHGLVVAQIVFATTAVMFATYAGAAQYQCGALSNYFSGYYHNPATHSQQFEGASGFITTQPAYTCFTDTSGPSLPNNTIGNNFTTAWIMIASNSQNDWSQVGYIAGYAQTEYYWAEVIVNYGSSPYERFDRFLPYTPATGSRHAYYEKFLYGCAAPTNHACEESIVDSTRVTDTNFNPFASSGYRFDGAPKWSPQYSGEKTYPGSDILGTAGAHVKFGSIGAQQFSNDQLILEPCTLTSVHNASRSGLAASGCHDFDIWTTTP